CFASPQIFAAQNLPIGLSTQSEKSLSSYYYNFGYVPVDSSAYQEFNFTSYYGDTTIYSIYTFGIGYSSLDNCPYLLYIRDSCTIRVYFRPWGTGYQTGETHINTGNGTSYIYLSGYG